MSNPVQDEKIVKQVMKFGDKGAHVVVPKKLIGKFVVITEVDSQEN